MQLFLSSSFVKGLPSIFCIVLLLSFIFEIVTPVTPLYIHQWIMDYRDFEFLLLSLDIQRFYDHRCSSPLFLVNVSHSHFKKKPNNTGPNSNMRLFLVKSIFNGGPF